MDIKFGTGGFRGVIGDDFIKENIKKIAQAICNLANENNLKKDIKCLFLNHKIPIK